MKPAFRLAAPLLAAALLAGCGDDAADHLARAKAAWQATDYATARVEYNAVLREQPENREVLLMLARAQVRLGDPDGAQTSLDRLGRLGAKGPEIERLHAEVLLLQGKPGPALTRLGNDASPDGWRIRAMALLAQGDAVGAEAAYARGVALGDDVRLLSDYLHYRLQNGDPAGAASLLARLKALAPDSFETLIAAGDMAAGEGRTDEAIAIYRSANSKFPARPEPLLALANAYDSAGKLELAIAAVKAAEKAAPGDARLKPLQVQLYSEKGDWEKVRDLLEHDEDELDPRSSNGLTYAEALLRLGHPEQARVIFGRAVLLSPGNRYARMMLGEALLATGDAAAAWEALRPLTEGVVVQGRELELAGKAARAAGDPAADAIAARLASPQLGEVQALSGQGQRAFMRQDWSAALEAYSRLNAMGRDGEVLRRMAIASSKLGRHAEAIGLADQAMTLQPGNPEMVFVAGQVRLAAGQDMGAAIGLLRKAAAMEPGNPVFASELAKAKAAAG